MANFDWAFAVAENVEEELAIREFCSSLLIFAKRMEMPIKSTYKGVSIIGSPHQTTDELIEIYMSEKTQ